MDEIKAIHRRSRQTYGMPRVHAELSEQGVRVGGKRVARLMRAAGLQGVSRRKWVTTTVRDADARPAPDLVQRHFSAKAPDALWVADITYIPTWAGFLYLAVVLDAFSRRVVGWAMQIHLRGRARPASPGDGLRAAPTRSSRAPFRPRHPVHLDRLRHALPRDGRASLDGIGGRLLRQRHGRELLRHPGMRAVGAASLQEPGRSRDRGVRLHRRLVQPAAPSFLARVPVSGAVREKPCYRGLTNQVVNRPRKRVNSRQGVTAALGQSSNVADKLSQAAGAVSTAAHALESVVVDYKMARETTAQMVGELRGLVESAKREAALTADVLARIDAATQKLVDAQKQADGYLEGVSRVLGESHQAFADNMRKTLSEANQDFYTQLTTATTLLREGIEELGLALELNDARSPGR